MFETSHKKIKKVGSAILTTYLACSVFSFGLISCTSNDIKKPVKTEKTSIKSVTKDLPQTTGKKSSRPMPSFSPPKENAANVELEEVPLNAAKNKSEQAKNEKKLSQKDSARPTGKTNTNGLNQNHENRPANGSFEMNKGTQGKRLNNTIGLSINLGTSPQSSAAPLSDFGSSKNATDSNESKAATAESTAAGGGGAPGNGSGNALNIIGTTYGQADRKEKTVIPERAKEEKDEDIVARQIREAAHLESNETLKRKLWLEYEKYRAGLNN